MIRTVHSPIIHGDVIDFHLFSMMAEHAATALFSSGLYEKSERKRETYRGMMDLLLK